MHGRASKESCEGLLDHNCDMLWQSQLMTKHYKFNMILAFPRASHSFRSNNNILNMQSQILLQKLMISTFLASKRPTRHIKNTLTTGRAAETARLIKDTILECHSMVVLTGKFSHLRLMASTDSCRNVNCSIGPLMLGAS